MAAPAITVCIPAFKAERYIGETLASIRAQTFTDFEVSIVEDGSHDSTEEIVRAFARTISQPVHFQRHTSNQGLPGTRNTAIAAARGEWIALIDSDDLWTPDHLARTVAHARETSADLTHSRIVLFDSDTGRDLETRGPSAAARADFPLSLFTGDYSIQPSATLIRREKLNAVRGFDPDCRYVEDRELWMRLVRSGARFAYIDAVTCRYRQHANAMTRNAPAMAVGVAEVFERNADWDAIPLTLRRERAASAWLDAGRLVLRSDPQLARAYIARARRHQPWAARLLAYRCAAAMLARFKGKTV